MARARRSVPRPRRVETLEARQVMSADPLAELLGGAISHHSVLDAPMVQHQAALDAPPLVQHAGLDLPLGHHGSTDLLGAEPDFWLDPNDGNTLESQVGQIEQTLASAHLLTGLNTVRANYGFTGAGQTVAVIDSGIAWDHFALGGGLGSGYRVVGGWDFTENDANPYDDGPSGFHGTHVSGIIGADGGVNSGVAPGVDLVGLRVFSDTGAGYFSWVENALRWVHTNRNSFENPITAVNLSLGTNWNASTVPNWANLEDEFAQLEADGIFISVSAGNSFASYNTPGLSYPAASPYVVPVMSVNDAGVLSGFSQRHTRAIAAPGQFITSTVPDYAGNNNGVADDYASASGTSMAAPYVAGASVLVREAMQFVGMTGITQDVIYDHLTATADTFFDSATNQSYKRLNLGRAIDALMPEDDYGSSVETAYNLGSIGGTLQSQMAMSGVIGKLDDADYFTFTATATGRATFNTSAGTHQFAASWQGMGAPGWSLNAGSGYAMDVVAGQTYTVALSSSAGLGYYGLSVSFENTFRYVDWGAVGAQQTRSDLATSGEQWYRISASRSGYLTVDAVAGGAGVAVDLYNANQQLVAQGGAGDRVDTLATEGQAFYIRVGGTASGVGLRLTNAVGVAGSAVTVTGTAGADNFSFTSGPTHQLTLNGVAYALSGATYTSFAFNGGAGADQATVTGNAGADTATIRLGTAELSGAGYSVTLNSVEQIAFHGGGGADTATMHDSAGDDTLVAYSDRAILSGAGYQNAAHGFKSVTIVATAGYDTATLYDSAGVDRFVGGRNYGLLRGVDGSYYNYAQGFDDITAIASAGQDVATFNGTTGADLLTASPTTAEQISTGSSYRTRGTGFDMTIAYSNGGADVARFQDGATNDDFVARSTHASLADAAGSYINYAMGFAQVEATSTAGGADRAFFYDSAGDDTYEAAPASGRMQGAGYSNAATGFTNMLAYATTGNDTAVLTDSAGDDVFMAFPQYGQMRAANRWYTNLAWGFDAATAHASAGNDVATLYDSAGDDVLTARPESAELRAATGAFRYTAAGFDRVNAYASTGFDTASFFDGVTDDRFTAGANYTQMRSLSGTFFNYATDFDRVTAYSTAGGIDYATLFDGAGNDRFTSAGGYAVLEATNGAYANRAEGFAGVFAYAGRGGSDTALLLDSAGNDSVYGRGSDATITSSGRMARATAFATVRAESLLGGTDTTDVAAVDYVFERIGGWA